MNEDPPSSPAKETQLEVVSDTKIGCESGIPGYLRSLFVPTDILHLRPPTCMSSLLRAALVGSGCSLQKIGREGEDLIRSMALD